MAPVLEYAFTQSLTTAGLNAAMWRDLAILLGFVVAHRASSNTLTCRTTPRAATRPARFAPMVLADGP